ncbi:hypothetical protein [Roseivirga sp. E12]|uniref:hypothetical protein n=1 Tax=Roseivirga sp. E12 TaxID=2819237 RepID=UPI001ABC9708|nr:hypothetical protein [Roseivirga sp. E12]MBO3697370.1 hypothetical protein [Roseivirga sp. E12]
MRLGQLSRQLDISPDKIVKLLQDNFREVNNHPNVKLTEEELVFVQNEFQPVVEEESQENEIIEEKVEAPSQDITETPAEPETPEFIESLRPQVITLEEEFHAQTDGLELYKAEKPHLEGLKVVGKIDLPEPVVKEKDKEEPKKPERKARERNSNRRDRNSRGRNRNTLSPTEERKKAERLALKKKFEQEQRLKELKRKHYEENVKAKLVNTAPKKKKKAVQGPEAHVAPTTQTVHKGSIAKKSTQRSGNPLKRFWLWLNGAYDN